MMPFLMPILPKRFVWLFSKKYIAGETMEHALQKVSELKAGEVMSTLDILGEQINKKEDALKYQKEYLDIIDEAVSKDSDCTFSLKPTMFGLLLDFEFCYNIIRTIVEKASQKKYMIRIDMEDSGCTDSELDLFERLYEEFPAHVGIVLQAYLKRTMTDIIWLKTRSNDKYPVNIRLCKGIYNEHPKIAFKGKEEIRENFMECLDRIFEYEMYPGIATHDEFLIEESTKLISELGISRDKYEFQMLLGVVPNLRRKLVEENHPMRVYVPYGKDWLRYSFRRLQENPKMLQHIIVSMFTNK